MQGLPEIKEKFDRLDTNKLTDVVKNYKQYGYSQDVRAYALELLKDRGITQEDLQLTGNFENHNYNSAERFFASFERNSRLSFLLYISLLCLAIIIKVLDIGSGAGLTVAYVILLFAYLICLLKSFISQSDYYKAIGSDYSNGALIYLFVGMPFYIVMYFILAKEMKEKMSEIK